MTSPLIGMLCWQASRIPRGLVQLESLPGNSTNPASFPFPVRYERIEGASFDTVVRHPSEAVLERMVDAVQAMQSDGIRAVTTSCGFNAIFQERLTESCDIPVLTSALLQLPWIERLISSGRTIGVVTANRPALTDAHLRACGVTSDARLRIVGVEGTSQWRSFHDDAQAEIDLELLEREVLTVVDDMAQAHRDLGAILLECTDLPPFAAAIRAATGLPVFDIVTLTRWAYDGVAGPPLPASHA